MRKRFLAGAIITVLLLTSCGNASSVKNTSEGESLINLPTTSFIEAGLTTKDFDGHISVFAYPVYDAFGAYEFLDDNQALVWQTYFNIWDKKETSALYEIPKMTADELSIVFDLFTSQFPSGSELQLSYKTSDTFEDDGTYSGIYFESLGEFDSNTSSKLYLTSTSILEALECDGTDQDKAFVIAKWLCDNVVYSSDYIISSLDSTYLIYDAIINKQSSSEGYAAAYNYLCTLAGLKSISIYGDFNGLNNHFWNMIKIDNGWYHVDTSQMKSENYYRYFCLTDSEIFVDHSNAKLYSNESNGISFVPNTPVAN